MSLTKSEFLQILAHECNIEITNAFAGTVTYDNMCMAVGQFKSNFPAILAKSSSQGYDEVLIFINSNILGFHAYFKMYDNPKKLHGDYWGYESLFTSGKQVDISIFDGIYDNWLRLDEEDVIE